MNADSLVEDAYRLADRWAAEVVYSECVPGSDGMGITWTFANETQAEVESLSEASEDVQEAVAWLTRRQLATLIRDDAGADVLMLTGAEDCL